MNINAMMKQAKKIQLEMEKAQKELAKKEFVIEKQGVEITFMGDRNIKSIKINKLLIDPDEKDILEDMIMIVINEMNKIIDQELAKLQPDSSNLPF